MANINLLPWREAQRRDRNRATGVICFAMIVGACLIVLTGKMIMDARISHQEARNSYLNSEIRALSKVIKEIEGLKDRRDDLVARMQVIQGLQSNRSQIVHVFDDLVTKLPEGVYFDSVSKRGRTFKIGGKAQSNNRVSTLMRSLDASNWFDNASLKVVDVIDQNGVSVSKFNVQVKEQRAKKSDEIQAIR